MRELQHLDISTLLDALSSLTEKYIKLQVEGKRGEEFYVCKRKIEKLQDEIELRHKIDHEIKVGEHIAVKRTRSYKT